MGMDYWPFGVEANKHCISTFVRHLYDQEIISKKPDVSDLFLNLEPRKPAAVNSGGKQ